MDNIDEHFAILDQTIQNAEDHALALKYAPRIYFDQNEPFLPSVVGYTVFRENTPSPSFPRNIDLGAEVACAIEYAIWWDWDIQHLYELEHIWLYLNADGNIINAEASWHGGYNIMRDENSNLPIEDGRLAVHSEPGKHAFAPTPAKLLERKPLTMRSCGVDAGKMGVHVPPLFNGIITERTPINNRYVHTHLERLQFTPTYKFLRRFSLEDVVFVPWEQLSAWIPSRVQWWTRQLQSTIATNETRGLRIAHRGASAYAQENSQEAFVKAAELGSDMVEIDVRVTSDDVPVISHDESLKRVYGIEASISNLTWEELKTLTEASGHNPIMMFDEVVKLCQSLGVGLYLDLKRLTFKSGAAILESLKQHGMLKYTIFGSFRPDWLAEIKAYESDATTSILFNSTHIDPVTLAQSIQCDYVHPCWERFEEPHKLLTAEWLERVRNHNLGIVCWHEERPSEIEALWQLGVEGICSDQPELLIRQM